MRPVWLDTDPGFDDWLTMLMLAAHPRLRWLGISVVAGNAPLAVTLANTLRIRHHYGLKVPVYAGCAQPLAGALETAQYVLGAQGMRTTGAALPEVDAVADGDDAVSALREALHRSAEPVTLLAIGPLTNIAHALQAEPGIVSRIAELVLMGGSSDRGNHTPAAEFNIHADPEAADIVFNAVGLKRRMFGLNLCRQVLLERRHVAQVQAWAGPRAAWLAGHLDAYQRIRSADGSVPMPLYDPVVAAWMWQPELFEFQPARVDIELQGRFTRGMTVCDFRVNAQRPANAEVAMTVDGPAVVERVLEAARASVSSGESGARAGRTSSENASVGNAPGGSPELLVFGSINLDIAFRADHLPRAGETVLGGGYQASPGGKGANQAHAAQRYGLATTLVGAVGDDAFAARALAQLQAAGVDLTALQRLPGPTGCAGIVVDAQGENQIVVAPGVNLALRASHASDGALSGVRAVLLQMETDAAENAALIGRAKRHGCLVVLNNAPARPLAADVLQALDVLIVNQIELAATAQGVGIAATDAPAQVRELARRFALTVVLTLGGDGVLACAGGAAPLRLPALPVQVVETTGAGDTFAGVFTAALVEQWPLREALMRGVVAAGLACARAGAQLAQPDRAEIEAALERYAAA